MVRGLRAEVEHPELIASARRFGRAGEAVMRRRALVAACLVPGLGDFSRPYDIHGRLLDGYRRTVESGNVEAVPLLAAAIRRTASGSTRQ